MNFNEIQAAVRQVARNGLTVPLTINGVSYQVTGQKQGPKWVATVVNGAGVTAWTIQLDGEPPRA